MASTVTRKRARTVRKTPRQSPLQTNERYLVDANGKRVAVMIDLAEYQRLVAGQPRVARMSAAERAKLVEMAKQSKGSWKESEGTGSAVEIVRRLRDEWER